MITEQELAGLLQRADWTRLSLTARVSRRFNRALRDELFRSTAPPWLPPWVRLMMDPDDMPMVIGDQVTGSLIVAPGGRFREELTGEGGDTTTRGCDGDRVWLVNPRLARTETPAGDPRADSGWRAYGGSPSPPFRQLLSPSWLLAGSGLSIEGAVTAAGREAWRVVVVPDEPRPSASSPRRFDLTVDAELGILLRCEAFVRGLPLWLEQLDAMRTGPPDAAGESPFAVPPDALADAKDLAGEHIPRGLLTAAGLAADVLGFAVRHGPGPRRPPADVTEPIPRDADDVGQEHWPLVRDRAVYLLHRASLRGHDVAAELNEWLGVDGFAEIVRRGGRAAGQGGIGRLADAISDKAAPATSHRVARLVHAADGTRYRLDWVARAPAGKPVTESCDGQTRWRVYPDRTLTGPARPAPSRVTKLVQPSWLLDWRLADGGEEIVDGRPGYRLRGTRIQGVTVSGPSLICDAIVAVVDIELAVITRLTCYAGGEPTERWELRDVNVPAPASPEEFGIQMPPGSQVEEEAGPLDEAPEAVRQVVRAAEQVRRVVGPAVARAAGFLGALKSRGQP